MAIKLSVPQNNKFNLPQDIDKIINSLSSDKTTGPDGISVKFIKLSANVIDSHLANIINKGIYLNIQKMLKLLMLDLFSKKMRKLK